MNPRGGLNPAPVSSWKKLVKQIVVGVGLGPVGIPVGTPVSHATPNQQGAMKHSPTAAITLGRHESASAPQNMADAFILPRSIYACQPAHESIERRFGRRVSWGFTPQRQDNWAVAPRLRWYALNGKGIPGTIPLSGSGSHPLIVARAVEARSVP